MFEGENGKAMMIAQGYVPATCELPPEIAGPLIYSEVSAGRDPCAGCNGNRATCGGRPKRENRPPAEPKPRPVSWRSRGDALQGETDYDQVILEHLDGTERETIRKNMDDAWEWEDATTVQDQSRGFLRYLRTRPRQDR